MRTNLLRHLVALAAIGSAAYGTADQQVMADNYRAPAHWNNFRPVGDRAAGQADSLIENLPSPVQGSQTKNHSMGLNAPESLNTPQGYLDPPGTHQHYGQPQGQPMHGQSSQPALAPQGQYSQDQYSQDQYSAPQNYSTAPAPADCNSCNSGYSSPYSTAMSAPWSGAPAASCGVAAAAARPQLYPWFAQADILFLNLENGSGRQIFKDYDWDTSLVDPDNSVGYSVTGGRYLGCGTYGLGVTYFNWDPSQEEAIRNIPAPSDSFMPHYDDVSYLNDGDTIDEHLDGTVNTATNVRLRRDLSFQSLELNLFSFGLMGAQRVSNNNCGRNGFLTGKHGSCYGYGGADGALARSRSGRVRVQTSHGFRWFQAEDELEYAYNIDGGPGYQDEDLYDNFQAENNLYGYQFGGTLTYCLGHKLTANVGGKVGIYGNDVEVRHRIGSVNTTAYVTGDNTNRIDRTASDTVLASLAELDLGLGYRLSNAWTVRGGFRLIGLTGVANAVDSYPSYANARELNVDADNSYLIRGGYVGLNFNW